MGITIPQVVTESSASGAQVIDGSLKFDGSKPTYLKRTFSAGNQRTWTWSAWVRRDSFGERHNLFGAPNTDANGHYIEYRNTDNFQLEDYGSGLDFIRTLDQVSRDTGWFHWVVVQDTTESTDNNKIKIYKNGVLQTDTSALTHPSLNEVGAISRAAEHRIGVFPTDTSSANFDGAMSQVYFIDGQALDASYFGFTDPLTNTWRPKKYNIGAENNSNNGTTWDSTYTLSYDGGVETDTVSGTSSFTGVNGNITSTLSSSVIVRKSLRLQMYASTANFDSFCDIQVNGSGEQTVTVHESQGNQAGIYDLNFTGTLSSIKVTAKNSANIGLAQVIVDDYVLINGAGDNKFYLPMDGNSPIGEDKSGKGNNWTPVNFGGSVALDNPIVSGALPILNTDGGGNVARLGTRTDANAANLTLALPFIGTSPIDVSNSINSGSTTKTLGTSGTPTTDVSNFYGSSPHIVGNSSWYTLATTDDVEMGTGDYTLETFVYFHSFPVTFNYIFCNAGSNTSGFAAWIVKNDGAVYVTYYDGSSRPELISAAGVVATGRWYHLAWSRVSGTQHIFVDGVCVARGTWSENVNSSPDIRWGTNPAGTGSEYANISLSDFRIYKGVGKYTTSAVGEQAFVVPSTSPDILPDTPSGVSGSSKLAKVTDGAVAFDDTGDYLSLASSSDFTLSGEFTIECYAYYGGSGKGMWMTIGEPKNTSAPLGFEWYHTAGSSSNSYRVFGDNGYLFNVSNTTTSKVWHHVAISRDSSNNLRIWRDGIQIGSNVSDSNTYQGAVYIGAEFFNGSITDYMDGFISNFRFINGTCLYTSTFTPPTAPLTNVTNTKLLCCQSNTLAGSAAVSPNISGTNDGTVWSRNYTSTSNFNSSYPPSYAFNGSETTYAEPVDTGSTMTVTFDPPLVVSGNFEVKIGSSGELFTTINGGSSTSKGSGLTQYHTLGSDITVSNFTYTSSTRPVLYAVRINGSTILVDPVITNGNAAATNFNPFNTDINTVRGQETGYATWNPLSLRLNQGTLSDGNLTLSATGSYYIEAKSTFDSSMVDN